MPWYGKTNLIRAKIHPVWELFVFRAPIWDSVLTIQYDEFWKFGCCGKSQIKSETLLHHFVRILTWLLSKLIVCNSFTGHGSYRWLYNAIYNNVYSEYVPLCVFLSSYNSLGQSSYYASICSTNTDQQTNVGTGRETLESRTSLFHTPT